MPNTLIEQLGNPAVFLQINQRLAMATTLLLIVACAYLLVELTWLFVPQDHVSMPSGQKILNTTTNKQAQQENFRKLTSANIFGVSGRSAPQQSKAPETRLNLTLKGVLAAKPMNLGSAIIAQGRTGKEKTYGVGDKLPGGVRIKEIHPEYVVLERNGQLETLKLQKISGVSGFNKAARTSSNLSLNKSPAAALSNIRRDILKNPASFGDYALPVVVKENGKQIGYRLQPQRKGEMLAELGIQPSDVIVEINGVKLDKPQNGISALRKLSTAKNLTIIVKRNGAEVPLNITLQ